jgi:hypothetical protein
LGGSDLDRTVAGKNSRWSIPDNVRVSIGFTKWNGWHHSIGQCWLPTASSDNHFEIFVSPQIGDAKETIEIIATLAHELDHSCTPGCGHRGAFKQCALAIGLTGRMTATTAGPIMREFVEDVIVKKLGPYPAGKVEYSYRPPG